MTQTSAPVLFPPFLVATDGSPSAYLAQKLLVMIAQSTQSQQNVNGRSIVTVLSVQPRRSSRSKRAVPTQPSTQASLSTALTETTGQEPLSTAANAPLEPALESTAAIAPTPSADDLTKMMEALPPISFTVQVRQGRPAIEILNCARAMKAGLIAVGSRGTTNIRGRLMGNVSVVIARYAPCSVLVFRGAVMPPEAEPNLHHLLLVVNDSPATRQAIEATRQLIPAGVRQLTILYAEHPLNADYLFGPFATPTPSWQLNQSLQEAQKEQSEAVLEQTKTALSASNLEIHTLRQTGDPGPLICQIAQQQQVDLIVLGGNAMQRWLRFPSGEGLFPLQSFRRSKQPSGVETIKQPPALRNARLSAAEDYTLHHAPCPVLLCRSTSGQI
ncbi:MAG: universal stress protein [Lyngbya sp. HA4199-MV5]|jgi:nucleotide-binding universal stress UspA family protein|nr:universal stress protein [Lyngbya sp. HA4199-MV5]